LIALTRVEDVPPLPSTSQQCVDRLIPAKGTLIVVPSNLHDQWQREIKKFFGDPNGLHVLPIATIADLKGKTVAEIRKADIVLVGYKVLVAQKYQEHFDLLTGMTSATFTL